MTAGIGSRKLVVAVAMLAAPGIGTADAQTRSAGEFPPRNSARAEVETPVALRTAAPGSRWYASGEYLLWQVKGAPLSVPLVSTGPNVVERAGWITSPDVTILYGAPGGAAAGGNDTQQFPWGSGARVKLGYWLDDAQRMAIEAGGFLLAQRSAGFAMSSDASGSPVINVPVNNTILYSPIPGFFTFPGENGYPPALPGQLAGAISINNTLRLFGAEAAGVVTLQRSPGWHVSALIGARYLDLYERFDLWATSAGVPGSRFVGLSGSVSDLFETQNHFLGLMLGLHGGTSWGPFSIEATGRVAFGGNYKQLTVAGAYTSVNFPNAGMNSGPYGIFAQPANSGSFSSTDFAIVPEAQVKLGYDLTPSLRLSVGYDFLYISDVIRPGDQLNHSLPKGQIFQQGGSATSLTSPTPLFERTNFYAHGFNVGLTARF